MAITPITPKNAKNAIDFNNKTKAKEIEKFIDKEILNIWNKIYKLTLNVDCNEEVKKIIIDVYIKQGWNIIATRYGFSLYENKT